MFTAWITTDAGCLIGEHCDVQVLADDPTGRPAFSAELPESAYSSTVWATVAASAEAALREAGWELLPREAGELGEFLAADRRWALVPSGAVAEVRRVSC